MPFLSQGHLPHSVPQNSSREQFGVRQPRCRFFPTTRSTQHLAGLNKLALALTTVLRDVFLQAGDGHRHPYRQLPLFGGRQVPEPYQPPHPIARLDELAFEPSMFRTSYRQPRRRAHPAPVESRDSQTTIKANKKQTFFFALSSPLCAQYTNDSAPNR